MEIHTDIPKKRYKELPRYEPIVKDSSVIMTYKTCPLKYFYRYVLGYTRQGTPAYFVFGRCYHFFRDQLEIEYKKFIDNNEAREDAVDMAYFIAAQETLKLWDKLSPTITPDPKFDFLTKALLKTSMEYVWKNKWKKEKLVGAITVIATEQPFNIQISDGSTEWWLGGRADQVIKWNQRLWGRDFKTSSKEDKWFARGTNPNHQFILYTVAEGILHGEMIQGQLVEMLYNGEPPKKASTKPRGPEIYSHPVSFTKEQQDNFKEEVIRWLQLMDRSRDTDLYPKNEGHCTFCEFHEVCKNGNERGMIQTLKQKYQTKIWDFNNPDND